MSVTKSEISSHDIQVPDYDKLVSDDAIEKIRKVRWFAQSQYANLIIRDTLVFYTNRYVRQLSDFSHPGADTTIVDVGAGLGWLCMAFAFATDAKMIAVDVNEDRLAAGKEIAGILGVGHRIDWRVGGVDALPLGDREGDVVYCIEVLEHVYRSEKALHELCRVTGDLLVLTTPNLWFPVIAHDTQLPFCHWLPVPWRNIYAKMFNRTNRENDNLFWSPCTLRKNLRDFKPMSKWLHYSSYEKFLATFPFYLPYGAGSYVRRLGMLKKMYYDVVSRLGMNSHWVVPSLAYVFKRRP